MTNQMEVPRHDGAQPSTAAGPSEGASLIVTSDESDLAAARQRTADYLRDRCDWVDRPAVLLVVSELLSNAVLHGGGWWRLVVVGTAWQLRIEVEDRESRVPSIRQASTGGGPGGLGMHIVSRLVTSYEAAVDPAGAGKTVRALWNRPASHDLNHDLSSG